MWNKIPKMEFVQKKQKKKPLVWENAQKPKSHIS